MNIVHLCLSGLGGSSTFAIRLAEALVEEGHTCTVVAEAIPFAARQPDTDPTTNHTTINDVNYYTLPDISHEVLDQAVLKNLIWTQLLGEVAQDADIIHVHYALPKLFVALQAKQLFNLKAKVVVTAHGTDISQAGPEIQTVLKEAFTSADAVTAVSKYMKRLITEALDISHISTVYNWAPEYTLDPAKITALKDQFTKTDELVLFHASNFRTVKQTPHTVHALAALLKERPARLILAGDGSQKESVEQLVAQLGLEENVTFLGKISNVEEFLAFSDICLIPSLTESFSLVTAEAATLDLGTNDTLRSTMSQNARAYIKRFNKEATISQYEIIYQTIKGNK